MTDAWWIGIAAGVLIAGIHTVLRVLFDRRSRGSDDPDAFVRLTLGGMLVRMAAVLLAVGLVLAFADVNVRVFAFTLIGLLLVSMIAEAVWAMRRMNDDPP